MIIVSYNYLFTSLLISITYEVMGYADSLWAFSINNIIKRASLC